MSKIEFSLHTIVVALIIALVSIKAAKVYLVLLLISYVVSIVFLLSASDFFNDKFNLSSSTIMSFINLSALVLSLTIIPETTNVTKTFFDTKLHQLESLKSNKNRYIGGYHVGDRVCIAGCSTELLNEMIDDQHKVISTLKETDTILNINSKKFTFWFAFVAFILDILLLIFFRQKKSE